MAYASIIAKQSESFIKNLREELHVQVTAEFCAKHNIENPYLSREEMDALATNNGTAKPLKFGDCPYNIFISPSSNLTFAGYYLDTTQINTLLHMGKPNSTNTHVIYIIKLFINEMVLPLCKVKETDKFHLTFTSSEERDIEFFKEKYYVDLNRTYYYEGKQFHIAYPKMPLRIMSRYMIEFINRENPDILALPFAIKYDFYLQERMGFINLYNCNCKIAEMNELIDAHKNMVAEFDKRSELKLQEIAEKERITDKYIESAQKYREETKAQLDEREQELNAKSAALEIFIAENEQKYGMAKNLATVKDDLLGLCEEMLIMSNGDHKMHEIKQKLMQIYSNTVDIAIATPIANE